MTSGFSPSYDFFQHFHPFLFSYAYEQMYQARLLTGGDIWNISPTQGGYIVPKPAPGQLPVSAIYAGGV